MRLASTGDVRSKREATAKTENKSQYGNKHWSLNERDCGLDEGRRGPQ